MSKPHWTRHALRFLPKSLLSRWKPAPQFDFEWPEQLELKLATHKSEFEQAYKLMHEQLAGRDGLEPHPSGMLLLPQHIMPQTHLVIAKWENRVIGALSLICDNPLGLPMDKAMSLRSHRTGPRRVAEVALIAIAPEFKENHNRALLPMLKYVYHLSKRSMGLSRLVARLSPTQLQACQSVLGFELIETRSPIRPDNKHNGDISLFIDIDNFERKLAFAYAYKPRSRNLMTYLNTLPESRFMQFPDRKYHRVSEVVISPAIMNDLIFAEATLHERLSPDELKIVSRFYRHPNYHEVLGRWTGFRPVRSTSEWRIDTHLTGDLGLASQRMEVWNVSRNGCFITTQTRLEKGQHLFLRVHLNDRLLARVKAEVQWIRRAHEYGVRITEQSPEWTEMVTELERRFLQVAGETNKTKSKGKSGANKTGAASAA